MGEGSNPTKWYRERLDSSRYIAEGRGRGEDGAVTDTGVVAGGMNATDVMDEYVSISMRCVH